MTDSPTETHDTPPQDQQDPSTPDAGRDSVGNDIGATEIHHDDRPAPSLETVPIAVSTVLRICELLDVMPATESARVGQIRALLPAV